MGTITGARATQMDMPRHLPTYSWVIDCLHLIAWTLHTPHTIGCWRLSSNIPPAIIITYDLIYPQYMQFWFILGHFCPEETSPCACTGWSWSGSGSSCWLCWCCCRCCCCGSQAQGWAARRAPDSPCQTWAATPATREEPRKWQLIIIIFVQIPNSQMDAMQTIQIDQHCFYDYRLYCNYSPWSCRQGTLWRPWSVCCWSLPPASGCCWRHPGNEGVSILVLCYLLYYCLCMFLC